jgi:hypothetical protein
MRTTLDLPDALFRELKSRAALRGLKMKDLLAELVADGLRASGPRAAPTRRSPLPVARQAGCGPRIPARRNAELQRLLDAEDAKRHAGR